MVCSSLPDNLVKLLGKQEDAIEAQQLCHQRSFCSFCNGRHSVVAADNFSMCPLQASDSTEDSNIKSYTLKSVSNVASYLRDYALHCCHVFHDASCLPASITKQNKVMLQLMLSRAICDKAAWCSILKQAWCENVLLMVSQARPKLCCDLATSACAQSMPLLCVVCIAIASHQVSEEHVVMRKPANLRW